METIAKTAKWTMLTLIITSVLMCALNIRPVRATTTIYIRADGSIDPPTAPISTSDYVTYTFTDDITGSIVVQRNDTIIDGMDHTLQGTGWPYETGFTGDGLSNVTIRNVLVTRFYDGIYFPYASSNITVTKVNLTRNSGEGIFLPGSLPSGLNHDISFNIIRDNAFGVEVGGPCTIAYNTIADNGYGFGSHASATIIQNEIVNNSVGMVLVNGGFELVGNNIMNNGQAFYGIRSSADQVSIYHNNFANNTITTDLFKGVSWDDGYPSGGNYWSDYTGVDLYSGPYQNETGKDGIGDTPYVINAMHWDNYPLMNPWPIRTVERAVRIAGKDYAITTESNVTLGNVAATKNALHFTTSGPSGTIGYANITFPMGLNKTEIKVFIDGQQLNPPPFPVITSNGTHYFIYFEFSLSDHDVTVQFANADLATSNIFSTKTVIGQGYPANVSVAVENKGDYEESFSVTFLANDIPILTQTVALTSGNSTSIIFTWDTTAFVFDNYTISASAEVILGETNTSNNLCIDGLVAVVIPGDIDSDGTVNILDAIVMSNHFLDQPGKPGWDEGGANADINSDNVVNILDSIIQANHFLEHYP